jgi:hypothetical protein
MSADIKVRVERFYSAHHALLRMARDDLKKAQAKEPGWSDYQFSAIILSALVIEAFCNAVGTKTINDWRDFENASPIAKLRLICEHLNINFDSKAKPWNTIIWLSKIRNLIAHPKAEPIIYENVISKREHKTQAYREAPKSKLEKEITLGNAKRAIESIDLVIERICSQLTPDQNFGITGDMWHSSSSLHQG